MLINKKDQGISIGDKDLRVGRFVYANDESSYEGLVGEILEIRTEEDRDTENGTEDIYVNFSSDEVIMAPSMLEHYKYEQEHCIEDLRRYKELFKCEVLAYLEIGNLSLELTSYEDGSVSYVVCGRYVREKSFWWETVGFADDEVEFVDNLELAMRVILKKYSDNIITFKNPIVV